MTFSRTHLTSLEALTGAAEWLRTLAHPHRLRMLQMLEHSRYTVGELAEACNLSSAMASEHLRLMQRCGLLNSQRDGRRVYYSIIEPKLSDILRCLTSRYGSTS